MKNAISFLFLVQFLQSQKYKTQFFMDILYLFEINYIFIALTYKLTLKKLLFKFLGYIVQSSHFCQMRST